ncbi:MAG: hypothetical protein AAGD38_02735 [Acidobacteriota bacterium]
MDESPEAKRKEYELLRQEFVHHDNVTFNILVMTYGFFGVVCALAIETTSPYLFLVPPVIFIIAAFYVADKRWAIWNIATYAKVFLEGDSGLRWEGRLSTLRDLGRTGRVDFSPGNNMIAIERTIFIASSTLSIALCAGTVDWNSDGLRAGSAIASVWLLSWAAIFHAYRGLLHEGGSDGQLLDRWQAVAATERDPTPVPDTDSE